MKDTRAGGGGAFSRKPMSINRLQRAVVGLAIEVANCPHGKSPLRACVDTSNPIFILP